MDNTQPEPTAPVVSPLPVPENIWLHGLVMLVFLVLINVALYLLGICALVQFLWMLFGKERNQGIAGFADGLAVWLAAAARFVSGRADERPFPWAAWK
jgi:hypothetical protein